MAGHHDHPRLRTQGAAAAITYADGDSPVTTFVVGALVAITTWAAAYAAEHRH